MYPHNLFTAVKVTRLMAPIGAGTDAYVTAGVDMKGYDGVMFVTGFGTSHAGHVVKAMCGNAAASGSITSEITCNQLTGPGTASGSGQDAWAKAYAATATVTTTGGEVGVMVDVIRPQKRYVGVTITPGASSTIETTWAVRYRFDSEPVINNEAVGNTGVIGAVCQALS